MNSELTKTEKLIIGLYRFNRQIPLNRDIPTFMMGAQIAFIISIIIFLIIHNLLNLFLPAQRYNKDLALFVSVVYLIILFYLLFYFEKKFKKVLFKAIDLGIFPEEERKIIDKNYKSREELIPKSNLVNYCPQCNRIEENYREGKCSVCGSELRTIQ